ncbi:hypothetical protein QQS21_009129 [Conoideocrella luteorostrata]|uniref:Uncharacterized protein n=1 Tax=Conoideocrella luteorostrata TaxID=1105319 RepID=A0AAJ0FQP9_9HYPO|nr:hypothetical protein QQS21_009129 [Conoideocrella luteorostrata]
MPRPRRTRQAPSANNPNPKPGAFIATDEDDEQRGRTGGLKRAARSLKTHKTHNRINEEDALRAANQSRDAALDRLANEDPTVTSGPDDTRSSVEIGRRVLATPSMRRDTTGLDLADDSVFGDLGDSFADGDVPEAPHSAASSSMTLSHFKTRPRSRQSSIIGRNDPPIRPSSRGGNSTAGVSSSFNIGVFRRRAREPSILATSRRARSRTGSVAGSAAGSVTSSRAASVAQDSELESEGEFAPEAESTPLDNRRRSRRTQQQVEREPSPERRRRSTRKRKSEDDAELGTDRPGKISRVEANGGLDINSDSDLSDVPSPSPPARFVRPITPVNMDEITAPPASSDSEHDDAVWPDIHTLAKKRRRPSVTTPLRNNDDLSDISTPPSLTHSPNLATTTRGRAASKRNPSPKITTADLASLLPKRRYKRNRDDFDIDSDVEGDASSKDDGDDDGPSRQVSRSGRRKGSRPPSRATSRPATRGGAHSRLHNVLKPKQTLASVRRSARTANKTYRRQEDKENESEGADDENDNSQFAPLPDDTFDDAGAMVADIQNADELKKASKKFLEVDQWELSFEEVAEPPSDQGAR